MKAYEFIMSQSSAASNISDHDPATGSAGRNIRGRSSIRETSPSPPPVPPPREIKFTIIFDKTIELIVLDDYATVRYLKRSIEGRLKIPVEKQFLYGWPDESGEPTDESLLKDLNLKLDTYLYVAIEGSLEDGYGFNDYGNEVGAGPSRPRIAEGSTAPASPDTGSQIVPASSQTHGPELPRSISFNVRDAANMQYYPEIPIDENLTIKDVKLLFEGITCIPVELQEWGGWPVNATDESILKDIDLETPAHSLVVRQREIGSDIPNQVPARISVHDPEESNSNSESLLDIPCPIPVDVGGNSNSVVSDIHSTASAPPGPLTPPDSVEKTKPVSVSRRLPVAKKSTSRGALLDLQKLKREGPTPSTSKSNNGDETVHVTPKKIRLDESQSKKKSPRKCKECHLLKLPEKVVNQLLLYLDPSEELSLRRTCKTTKQWVTRSDAILPSDERKWKRFSLTITESGHKTFENAQKMRLPISKFIFDIQNESFYDSDSVPAFISGLCLRVKDLTLRKFFMFENPRELLLLNSFLQLEKLTLDEIVASQRSVPVPCPATFRNLQVLKLNYEIDVPEQNQLTRPKSWNMTWGMLMDCQSLLYFRFPRLNENVENPIQNGDGIFDPILDFIELKTRNYGIALEYLDLKHFNNVKTRYVNRFFSLLNKCHRKDIKLKNVDALVVQEVFDEDVGYGDEKFEFTENVVSLLNYGPFVENSPMRNVEKFKIDVVPSVTDNTTMGKAYKNVFWPKLRTIKLLDRRQAKRTPTLWASWQMLQEDLYGHNGSFDRGSVEFIRIDSPKLPYFLGEGKLAQHFTNLKRLEICAWYGADREAVLNKRLWPIWTNLRLEELRIENCPKLNDYTFIGMDPDADNAEEESDSESSTVPVFLSLKPTLKKMTLGLDGVKKVTDRSFKEVFSKMNFKTFIILASTPTNISESAILAMHAGPFGENIERFPFDSWSSCKIDAARFKRLGSSFRSIV